LKIVVPMAGPDRAFAEAGYPFCKSLVEIQRRPLIEHVVEPLRCIPDSEFIFIIRKEDAVRFHLDQVLEMLVPSCSVFVAETTTAGAVCSVLLAIEMIEEDHELLITNGDQILEVDLNAILADFRGRELDAGTIVFRSVHPRWSFVSVDPETGLVTEAAEKRPISHLATAGFYYFRRAQSFVDGAMQMILKGAHVNGQFFVCPVFNELLLKQMRIGVVKVEQDAYISLATPQGVAWYEKKLESNVE